MPSFLFSVGGIAFSISLWYNESTTSEEKAKKWSGLAMQEGYDLSTIQNHHHTLAKLWAWEFSICESHHGGNEKEFP